MIDTGDTAWLLASTALVLLMAPGLALFYGGMVRAKSVLNMMMMTFGALGAVTVVWSLVGCSMAFGDIGLGLLGNPGEYFGLSSLMRAGANGDSHVPLILFAAFQGLFAVITGALVSGASALAVALVVGRRVGFGKDPMRPHNLTLVMLGAGLLWFGWFGVQRQLRPWGQPDRRRGLHEHPARRMHRRAGLARCRAVPGRPRHVTGRGVRPARRRGGRSAGTVLVGSPIRSMERNVEG